VQLAPRGGTGSWIDLNCPYHGTWGEKSRPGKLRDRRRELLAYANVDDDPEAVRAATDLGAPGPVQPRRKAAEVARTLTLNARRSNASPPPGKNDAQSSNRPLQSPENSDKSNEPEQLTRLFGLPAGVKAGVNSTPTICLVAV
jgi:hypothetical protein